MLEGLRTVFKRQNLNQKSVTPEEDLAEVSLGGQIPPPRQQEHSQVESASVIWLDSEKDISIDFNKNENKDLLRS